MAHARFGALGAAFIGMLYGAALGYRILVLLRSMTEFANGTRSA
jgi:hypothetical protein